MNLTTPDKIRNLQRKLYCKAKAEPIFRFYLLYDKICREDILVHAYRLARVNAGAPGVDGMTFARIEEQGLEAWLAGLRAELVAKTYRPDPVRRVMIPKANGGERPLGIPTIRDRVIQTAAKIVIEPIFEADFEDNAYGYRPARGAVDAVKDVHWHEWRQGKQARHAARRRREPTARQYLHEPVPEALASHRSRRSFPCPHRLLCRRLRHPQPRSCGRGPGVDEGGDDQAWVDNQRGENLVERCPTGALRLSWLFVRTALVRGEGQTVPGREPVQEERATVQGDGRPNSGPRQQRPMAGRTRHAEQVTARLVKLLWLWVATHGVPQCRPIRLRTRTLVPRATAQGARARQSPVPIRCHSSGTRWAVPSTLAPICHVVSLG